MLLLRARLHQLQSVHLSMVHGSAVMVARNRRVTLPFSQIHEIRLEVLFSQNQLEPDSLGQMEKPTISFHRRSQKLAVTLQTNRLPGR